MKNHLNNYFGFTKREYNAMLALMAILLLVSAFPYLKPFLVKNQPQTNGTVQKALQELVIVNQQKPAYYTNVRNTIEDSETVKNTSLFTFDPNKIDIADWQKLGLSVKQAQSIINYRNKGGKFYKPEDLQKMYTISPQKYQALLPFIQIESTGSNYSKPQYAEKPTYAKKELVIVDINTADTLALDEIKGVGAAFARRIVKYRERLGGFYKKEQLLEVYGLDSVKYNEIKSQVRIDGGGIKKININVATFDDLKNHPYLKFKQINAIIQYRKQHGNFNSVDDLKKVAILSPENIQN
ncbi:MAG: helix-hairpin-helix domain-containing protein, partial [Pedobacter sp.]